MVSVAGKGGTRFRQVDPELDAVRTARQRCLRHDWVLDIDIKAFFDSIRHMRAYP